MATVAKFGPVGQAGKQNSRLFERHFSPAELAEVLNLSEDTVRRIFEHESDVLIAAKQKFASFIILADRPYVRELVGDEKEAELQLLKSRDGKIGRIKAAFNIKTLRFEEERAAMDDSLWRHPSQLTERED